MQQVAAQSVAGQVEHGHAGDGKERQDQRGKVSERHGKWMMDESPLVLPVQS
jgi:hypothetical protein